MSKTIQEVADEHVLDLKTARQDILNEYISKKGRTDWCYTEECVSQALSEAGLHEGTMYEDAMRLVFEQLRPLGVEAAPPALMQGPNDMREQDVEVDA